MARSYNRWTKEQLEPIVSSSQSYADCLKQMGLKPAGGNYKNLISNIHKFGLSTEHMLHQAHNKGKELVPFEGLTRGPSIKARLVKELGHVCQQCKQHTWNNAPIPLELEHIDGNNRNNKRENLTLLCCNCHAQTPTWRNRKR